MLTSVYCIAINYIIFIVYASKGQKRTLNTKSAYVTGFAKRGLPHTFNLPTLTICNYGLVEVIDLKFGKQKEPT